MNFRRLLLFTTLCLVLTLTLYGQRTCGTMENLKEMEQKDRNLKLQRSLLEKQVQDWIKSNPAQSRAAAVITIPVVFHIIHDGDAIGTDENISDAQIMAQLDQINDDYRRMNSDAGNTAPEFTGVVADVELEFCLATVDPEGDITTGITRYNLGQIDWTRGEINANVKPQTNWDRDSYLNFWTVRFGGPDAGLLGYATFPGGPANQDGVVCKFNSIGSIANPFPGAAPYNLGRTATHEIGHWLSFIHIWGDDEGEGIDSCAVGTDLCADTPNQAESYGGCPSNPQTTCGSNDMFMNYMDYVNDDCMNVFTMDQKSRSDATMAGPRLSLQSSNGCGIAQIPVSNFSPSTGPVTFCPGKTLQFIDISTNGPDFWSWTFSGAGVSPTVSADKNPVVTITPVEGMYTLTVTLTATNGVGAGNNFSADIMIDVKCADDAACAEQTDFQPIIDSDFEDQNSSGAWTEFSSTGFVLISDLNPANSGDFSVFMGGASDETAQISQQVTIPAEALSANLSWYYWLTNAGADCNLDIFNLRVDGAVISSTEICDANETFWTQHPTVDLLAYAGSTITVMWEVIISPSTSGIYFVDDAILDLALPLVCIASTPVLTSPGEYTADFACTDGSGWTHYMTCENELLLSLELGGSGAVIQPGNVTLKIEADATFLAGGTSFVSNTEGWAVMRRTWNVVPDVAPASDVGVRYYYEASDFAQVNATLISNSLIPLETESQMAYYKVTSSDLPWDYLNIDPTEIIEINNAASATTTSWKSGTAANATPYAEFKVSSFSGGGGGGGSNGDSPLPAQLLSFDARLMSGNVQLNWTTASEKDVEKYEIEKSDDSKDWVSIGEIAAEGVSGDFQNYSFLDEQPKEGINFYRLKISDLDGSIIYSNIRQVTLAERRFELQVSPNPVQSVLKIEVQNVLDVESGDIVIFNASGAIVEKVMTNGESVHYVGVESWSPGVYFIQYKSGQGVSVKRVMVE